MPKDLILLINEKAHERQKAGFDVINGSVGMMMLDDGSLPVASEIRSVLSRHVTDHDLSYSSVAGPKDYAEALRHWFLASDFDEVAKKGLFSVIATPGGTGALSLAFFASRTAHSILLFPSLDWPNYEAIAAGFGLEYASYELYEEGHFGLRALEKQIKETLTNHDKVVVVINDPCENPTGYSLSASEWQSLASLLNQKELRGRVELIVDVAYIDYAEEKTRSALKEAVRCLSKETVTSFCFSFSKTFSFYGLRIGALAIYGQERSSVESRESLATGEARALWSVPNHMAMNAVTELISKKETFSSLKKNVEENRQLVARRAALFLSEADAVGLPYYPYKDGFFVTLRVKDAFGLAERLMKKDIFLAPVKTNGLRVALCALSEKKLRGLAKAIKDTVEEEA